jgi:DNA-binding NarL/FixJ family response regulator
MASRELVVAIFDDVVHARGEQFHIPGLRVSVHAHADDAPGVCAACQPDVVFMDFSLGRGRKSGADAIRDLRSAGFAGRIVGISSDPAANAEMIAAGADDALGKKAHLRSYLVHLGARRLGPGGAAMRSP